jgi:transcriptional regulator with XRE-family HTH domain
MPSDREHPAFPVALRQFRRERRLSQAEVAVRAHMSPASVRAYESGGRHPKEQSVHALAIALGLPAEKTGKLLSAAGYALAGDPTYEFRFKGASLEELREDVQRRRWPAFVTNQGFEVVAMNDALPKLLAVTSDRYNDPSSRNLMAGMSDASLADRLENWEEVATFMIGLAKGDPRRYRDDEPALPWLEAPFANFLGGAPARIYQFTQLWESAPPIEHGLRHVYAVRWRAGPGQVLSFKGIMLVSDLLTELHFNEWIPDDARTWRWLDEISPP